MRDLGEIGYTAYVAARGKKAPAWGELHSSEQHAWRVAVVAGVEAQNARLARAQPSGDGVVDKDGNLSGGG